MSSGAYKGYLYRLAAVIGTMEEEDISQPYTFDQVRKFAKSKGVAISYGVNFYKALKLLVEEGLVEVDYAEGELLISPMGFGGSGEGSKVLEQLEALKSYPMYTKKGEGFEPSRGYDEARRRLVVEPLASYWKGLEKVPRESKMESLSSIEDSLSDIKSKKDIFWGKTQESGELKSLRKKAFLSESKFSHEPFSSKEYSEAARVFRKGTLRYGKELGLRTEDIPVGFGGSADERKLYHLLGQIDASDEEIEEIEKLEEE